MEKKKGTGENIAEEAKEDAGMKRKGAYTTVNSS